MKHDAIVLKDLKTIKEDLDEIKEGPSPLRYFVALLILLLFVSLMIPMYWFKKDPHPDHIPTLRDIVPLEYTATVIPNKTPLSTDRYDYLKKRDSVDPFIKQTATKIVTQACDASDAGTVCYEKALFYFVRDNIAYVSERNEYLETPAEVLVTGGADCDGHAILLASLLSSIGIPTRFVFVPGHVYIQVYEEQALDKYKQEYHWITLDPTCSTCTFGEEPNGYENKKKTIVG